MVETINTKIKNRHGLNISVLIEKNTIFINYILNISLSINRLNNILAKTIRCTKAKKVCFTKQIAGSAKV